jgi:hypothetical protein
MSTFDFSAFGHLTLAEVVSVVAMIGIAVIARRDLVRERKGIVPRVDLKP